MVERSKRQDAEQSLRPDQPRSRGANGAVAAADDQKFIAPLGDLAAAHRIVAASDELDIGIDAGAGQRLARFAGKRRIGRDSAAAAIDEHRDSRHAGANASILFAGALADAVSVDMALDA